MLALHPMAALFDWSFNFDTNGQLRAGLFISLLSVWLLVGVFSYLNYYTRRRYFSIWTVAWLFYALYLTLAYSFYWDYGSFSGGPWWASMLKQWCISVAAVFMLWGSLRFLGRTVRQISLTLFLVFLLVWSLVANYPWPAGALMVPTDHLTLQLPIFILIGLSSVVTVWGFFQYRRKRKFMGAGLLAFGFLFWGLFVAAYPFMERMTDYMSTGFFIASVLQMFIAVNMIILVLEQIRHLRERRAARQLQGKEKEKAALRNRVILTEDRYRKLFEQSSEPIVITTTDDLRIVGLNEVAARIIGMSQTEAYQFSLTEWVPTPVNGTAQSAAGSAKFEFLCRQRFHELHQKDGTVVPIEIVGSAIDFAGETAYQFYLRQMTERSRLEQQLRQAQKLSGLGRMVSNVVHEVNSVLTVSIVHAELAEGDEAISPEAKDHLQKAVAENQRAAQMLRSFLNLAREGGEAKQSLDLNEIVRRVADLRRDECTRSKVDLQLNLGEGLPQIWANPDQIQQVMIILVNNALQAMENNTSPKLIRVTTRREADKIGMLFEDSGPGVPVLNRSRIFEPFFTTKPVGQGTGLGLSIAHGFVTDHHGTIEYCESALGGAGFHIQLSPLEAPVPRQSQPRSSTVSEPVAVAVN